MQEAYPEALRKIQREQLLPAYNYRSYYEKDSELKRAVDFIVSDTVKSVGCSENLERLYNELLNKDWFDIPGISRNILQSERKLIQLIPIAKAWAKNILIRSEKASGFFI